MTDSSTKRREKAFFIPRLREGHGEHGEKQVQRIIFFFVFFCAFCGQKIIAPIQNEILTQIQIYLLLDVSTGPQCGNYWS